MKVELYIHAKLGCLLNSAYSAFFKIMCAYRTVGGPSSLIPDPTLSREKGLATIVCFLGHAESAILIFLNK